MLEPVREPLPEHELSTTPEPSTPPVIRWIGIAATCLIVFVLAMVAYVHERSVASRLSASEVLAAVDKKLAVP